MPDEKTKLLKAIENFKKRLSSFEKIQNKFTDNKLIFLTALIAEDYILDLEERLKNTKITNDNKINEAEEINIKNIHVSNEINLANEKINFLINKIIKTKKYED
tara:strand:- start:219 stop:530 length:312 start_codon:yes stop_codon:yes gene_type:complete